MGYRDTISKLSFALVFIYLVFDIKLGGVFQYLDSSYFKLIASFVLIYFGLSTRSNNDLNISPSSLISVLMGIFGKQFNSEAGYDFYYFSPSRMSNGLEYSSIISGVLGLKLLISTYCVDFSWYIKTVTVMGISEALCLLVIFLDFYIYFQIFAKLRMHDFLYQVYHLQNSGGAWASVYICQIQSIGYVLSLVIYIIEFLESISQEFLDIALYSSGFIYKKFEFAFVAQKRVMLYPYNLINNFIDNIKLEFINIVSNICYIFSLYKQDLYLNFNNFFDELVINNLELDNLISSGMSKSNIKSQTYKIQKYCNTNLLNFDFLIIKDFFNTKKVFSNSTRFSEFKKLVFNDILGSNKKYLFSNNLMPVLRC